MKILKIDCHSHFGESFFGPKNLVNTYLQNSRKLNIVASIISPAPTPIIRQQDLIRTSCLWRKNGEKIIYTERKYNKKNGSITELTVKDNPYNKINSQILKLAKKLNSKNLGPKIFIAPLHHPKLDTINEVKEITSFEECVALKIHGVSTFTGPKNIKSNIIDLLKKIDKPVIAHVDFFNKKLTDDIHYAYMLNDPFEWITWAKETRIKTVITHGACLSEKAIKLAAKLKNVMINTAPDLLIAKEKERLCLKTKDLLFDLFSQLPSEKILFDIDYGWNVKQRGQWKLLDWKMCERIEKTAKKIGYITNDLENIYYKNALQFFNIKGRLRS
jgi:hypothetical protein